ncbi:MAG: GAF domain-containing protein [Gemmatimonadota bacterium]
MGSKGSTKSGDMASRLSGLCETGSAILETRDLQGILSVVTERTQHLFEGTGVAVTFLEADSREFLVAGASGSLEEITGARFPVGGTLTQRAIEEDRAVIDNDMSDHPFYEALALDPADPRTVLAVPLRQRSGALGSLVVVGRADPPGFVQDDADSLYAFGHLAGLAIENARLLEAETARARRSDNLRAESEDHITILQDLHAAEVAVASDLELDAVLQTVADRARDLTDAAYGALGVLTPEGDELELFITSGLDASQRERMGGPPKGLGLLGAVTHSKVPIRVHDMSSDPRSAGMPGTHPGMTSFLGVPIRIGDRAYGNLYLTNKEQDAAFTERDETIVSMLAAQAAVSIENARQFKTLQRLLDELRQTQQQRDRFYAFVNHDLRNACSGVLMWSERLLLETTGEARDIPEKIRRGSEHAMRLVQDVLDLESLSQGRLETWPRMIVVNDLLQATMDGIHPQAEQKKMRLRLKRNRSNLRMVADPDRVLQIMTNLLSNAIKYSPEGTDVRIAADLSREGPGEAGQAERWLAISVADQGPGVPEADQERIFGEYEKGGSGRRKRGGVGIGLTLSRRLAEYMGGDLTLESTPGEGATFTLWMPHGREPEQRSGWIG